MAKQTINQGTAPTGAGGDTFRTGSAKLQANDDELYAALGASSGVLPAALPIAKGGTGAATAAAARTNLGLTLTASNTDSVAGRITRVGDFGLGNMSDWNTHPSPNAILKANPTGFYRTSNSGWFTVSCSALHMHDGYWLSVIGIPTATNASPRYRVGNTEGANGTWGAEYIFRTTQNTATDANGFIKAASPIAQLYADNIHLNEEAQLQDITLEKLGVGDYLIKGSSGFAQEGWYVETPKDANGNVLVAVVYEQLENGDISVKTYDYMLNKKGRIVADTETPLDIPESRWIDLRLQELPQPEIEMPKSVTPPDFQPTGLAQAVATVMESYHDPEQ